MTQIVDTPQGPVQFPDGMSLEQMSAALRRMQPPGVKFPVSVGKQLTQESMAQEMASRDPAERLKAGIMGAFDSAGLGLKKLMEGGQSLSPQEQNRQDMLGAMQSGGYGKAGSILGRGAITTPVFLGTGGLAAGALPATGLTGTAIQAGVSGATGAGLGYALSPENRGQNAAIEGGGAVLGSLVGSGLAGLFRPKPGGAAALMQSQGVPITPGQAQGGMAKKFEDAAKLLNPGVTKAQQRSVAQWNYEQLKSVSPDPNAVSEVGHEGIKQVQASFKAAYTAADKGVPIVPDPQFGQDATKTLMAPGLTTDSTKKLAQQVEAARKLLAAKITAAGTFQSPGADAAAVRQMENDLNSAAKNAFNSGDPGLGRGMSKLADALEALRARQGAATPQLDRQYAAFSVLKDAASRPGAWATGVWTPQHLATSVAQSSSKGQRAIGEALMQTEAATARNVLGTSIPEIGPGTAEKGILGVGIPAAAYAALTNPSAYPSLLAGAGLYGAQRAAYTPMGVSFLTGAYPWQQALPPGLVPGLGAATTEGLLGR